MNEFNKDQFNNDNLEQELGGDKIIDKINFIRAVEQALGKLPQSEILEDRRVAFRTCNSWVLAWYLMEPDVLCLENFMDTVSKHSHFLLNCLRAIAQDTTIMWDPDDKQFWNKPDPSESAIKIGGHIRRNWNNVTTKDLTNITSSENTNKKVDVGLTPVESMFASICE